MNNEPDNQGWCQPLYERKAAGLILYGRALGLSHAEAEDVLQETFIALLRMASRPDDPANYAARVFRNRALNCRRSLWRRLTRELESARWFEPDGTHAPAELQAMESLTTLPPEQREVIVLKIWNQFTFEAIGELLDIPANTAAGRYRYGLKKLRALMQENDYERIERETVAVMDPAPPVG